METTSYTVIVDKIVLDGNHGPYAVGNSDDLGFVTFSLGRKVWKEKIRPEPGTYVVLSKVTKKRAGWRAEHGRFFQPSDQREKGEKSNES